MTPETLGPAELAFLARALRAVSLFSALSMGELDRVLNQTKLYRFDRGETLFHQGEAGDALFVVYDGAVSIRTRKFFLAPAKCLATLGPTDIFGEMALLDHPRRTATARAESTTRVFVLLAHDFSSLLRSNPAFAQALRDLAAGRRFESGRAG